MVTAHRCTLDLAFLCAPGNKHLRRSKPLVPAEEFGLHCVVISKYHKVSTSAPVSAHDVGTCYCGSCVVRSAKTGFRTSFRVFRFSRRFNNLRPGTPLLLYPAMAHSTYDFDSAALGLWETRCVVAANASRLVCSAATRGGFSFGSGLSGVDCGRSFAVPVVQVVCGRQTETNRLVAIVSVKV